MSKLTDELIIEIGKNLAYLNKYAKSQNILTISTVATKLQLQSEPLAEAVSEAYALMNETEDDFKIAVAEFMKNYDGSTAAAEPRALAANADLKRTWTKAKNAYKRFDLLLDRIDKICDVVRQRVSVIKQTDLKNV